MNHNQRHQLTQVSRHPMTYKEWNEKYPEIKFYIQDGPFPPRDQGYPPCAICKRQVLSGATCFFVERAPIHAHCLTSDLIEIFRMSKQFDRWKENLSTKRSI